MSERRETLVRRALLALAILPIVVAVVRAMLHHWFPISDNALLYIRVADVGTEHHPWLGSWTSASLSVGENMNNPGPLYDDLLAPFAKLFSPGPGAAIGVGVVNALSIVGISLFARRIGGWAMQQWSLLAAAALAWTMGSEMLFDIWQAHALLLPFLLFLVLLVGVADGRTVCIPWALAVATLLVQTHISYAYILAMLCPAAGVAYAVRRNGRPHLPLRASMRSRAAQASVLVVLVLWAQPLYEQCFGPGKGNLSRLAGNAGGGSLQVGGSQALGIGARLFALPPWWLRSGFADSIPNTPLTGDADNPQLSIQGLPGTALAAVSLLAVMALLVGLFVYHRRRSSTLYTSALLIASTGLVGSVLAVAKLTVGAVGLAAHHIRLLWPLAVFVHVVLAASLAPLVIGWVRQRLPRHHGPIGRIVAWAPAAVIVALCLSNVPYLAQQQGPITFASSMPAMRRVEPQLDVLRDVQPVLYDVSNVRFLEPYSSTVMMWLQEADIEFRVEDEGMIRQLGESRRADGDEPARIFQLEGADAVLYDGPACTVALTSALTEDEDGVAIEQAEQIAAELANGTITVDTLAFDPLDEATATILRAALDGDVEAATTLVYRGDVGRWIAEGTATSPRDLAPGFELIGRYVATAFGLFSDQSLPCP
ncbi:MAG: hypothetical protein ABMA25_09800 [Ilumatobacteraceae bacterium]